MTRLADLAYRLGFSSTEILLLRAQDKDVHSLVAKGFTASLQEQNYGTLRPESTKSLSGRIGSAMRGLQPPEVLNPDGLRYSTNELSQVTERRYNAPSLSQMSKQRNQLFLYSIAPDDRESGRYPTSLGITRDIIMCFLGDLYDYLPEGPHETSPTNLTDPYI
ncbi:hypothetical protein N7478_001440 [Penicillium angulare]|uniref:uncharacterized protein n=1 Tax=Penicillium angulare TaxID=116970 RepID=UPI002541ADCA|nr:uncharacterized protein N7478_001440 [Penicillium angulare]KAJ5292189.1 hypothetical protein N7478_001440 [Penicillium angulare]